MKKKKHRVMVEVTFDRPVAETDVTGLLHTVIAVANWEAAVTERHIKRADLVIQQEVRAALEARREPKAPSNPAGFSFGGLDDQ